MPFIPSYIKTYTNGEFQKRLINIAEILESCCICPHNCSIDRKNGELGFCRSGALPKVSAYSPHFGEEPVLACGSGTGNIFFGNCNLRCVYCQNYEISQNRKGKKQNEISHEQLSEIMLVLQNKGCNNIGLVSPTHYSSQILSSIYLAITKGLHLPIIYNSNGYDSVEILKLFDGIVDIYLPDFKYGNDKNAKKYSKVYNYFEYAKNAIREMYRQVGSELIYDGEIAVRGLIIRHLVLPNGLAESEKIFKFIAEELSPDIHISLMSQYYPTHKAGKYALVNRNIMESEFDKTLDLMDKYGLVNGWAQDLDSSENYRPNFELNPQNPFNN